MFLVNVVFLALCSLPAILGFDFYLLDQDEERTKLGYGVLMYTKSKGTLSGTVCNYRFTNLTADWICRLMGYESINSWNYGTLYPYQNNYPIALSNVGCTGSTLPKCSSRASPSCYHKKDIWLKCNVRSQLGDYPNSFYLIDGHQQYTQTGSGLLMFNGGTVSDDRFKDQSAEFICRVMGYESAVGWTYGKKFSWQDTYPIMLDNVQCTGSTLPICSSDTNTKEDKHKEDVWLACNLFTGSCPAGHHFVNKTWCQECPFNTYNPVPMQKSCLPCPGNTISIGGATHCTCIGGTYLKSWLYSPLCVQCPRGSVSKEGSMLSSDCVPCPTDSVPLNYKTACSCATEGYGWIWTTAGRGSCSPCPANTYTDKQSGICRTCPPEATSLPLSTACKCAGGLSWDGARCVDCATPGANSGACYKYNCSPGEFWNSDRCQMCPKNHVRNYGVTGCTRCPDGTFPSDDGTICLKPAPVNKLLWIIIVLSTLVLLMIVAVIFFIIGWKRKAKAGKEKAGPSVVYRAHPPAVEINEHGCGSEAVNRAGEEEEENIYSTI